MFSYSRMQQHICGVDLTFTRQDGATTITGLQFCSSSQFSYPLSTGTTRAGWLEPLAVSTQD